MTGPTPADLPQPPKREPEKPWAGRFREETSPLVDAYTSSLGVDRRIALEDVRGSIAHARMLAHQGIIPGEDGEAIVAGLSQIGEEIESGRFEWDERLEDVHMNVEARLAQLIGPAAGRLHTARSRNDQVVTDIRLWLKTAIAETIAGLHDLQQALVDLAAARYSRTKSRSETASMLLAEMAPNSSSLATISRSMG